MDEKMKIGFGTMYPFDETKNKTLLEPRSVMDAKLMINGRHVPGVVRQVVLDTGWYTDMVNKVCLEVDHFDIIPKLKVKKVIFNNPATIIFWTDGTKTVVKCQKGDVYSKEKGFVMAYLKKMLGNDNTFNKEINKWVWGEK